MPLMIFHTIWLPAYSTTRLSDLTWGNRERSSLDETEKALTRAENGAKVAKFLIGFNTAVAFTVIGLMQVYGNTFPIFVVTYTLVLSATYIVSFLEIFCRLFGVVDVVASRIVHTRDQEEEPTSGDQGTYEKMEDKSSSSSVWCCLRSSDSNETLKTTGSAGSVELGTLGKETNTYKSPTETEANATPEIETGFEQDSPKEIV